MNDPDRLLYHYTSLSSLEKILESRCFWAADTNFLNDSSEIVIARDVVRLCRQAHGYRHPDFPFGDVLADALTRLDRDCERNELPPVHIVSFSQDGDRLSQWRAYSKNEIGVSIGFRQEALRSVASRAGFELLDCIYLGDRYYTPDPDGLAANIGFEKIVRDHYKPIKSWGYGDDPEDAEKWVDIELAEARLSDFYTDHRHRFVKVMASMKHFSWNEEVEVRGVKISPRPTEIEYRQRGRETIPYLTLPLAGKSESVCIDEVRFWGSETPKQTHAYLTWLLKMRGVVASRSGDLCGVLPSANPFRPKSN